MKHPLELANVDRRRLQDDGAVILDDKVDAITRTEAKQIPNGLGQRELPLASDRRARHRVPPCWNLHGAAIAFDTLRVKAWRGLGVRAARMESSAIA